VEFSWKNSQRDGGVEKHSTKVSLNKKLQKSCSFQLERWAIWSIWIKIKANEKAKQPKIGANWMEFQQSMSFNL
jgi:hypothetical protein